MSFRLLAAAAAFALATAVPAFATEGLDAVLKAAMEGATVPAIGALVMRDGKIEEQAVFGVLRNDEKKRAALNDVWLIGSTGKVMTVAMVARLVERGVLAWDAPLKKTLPELAQAMRPEYRNVTLVQLLSHHSGLPRDIKDLKSVDKFFADTSPFPQQRLAYVTAALKDAPDTAPGTAFGYSNTGFLLAAVIAEKASGKNYEDLMLKEVFQPLGMASATFGNTHDGQNRGHRHGKPKINIANSDDGLPEMFSPAGYMAMNLGDWARFNLDQLAGSKGQGKLLAPASYRLMQSAQPGSPVGLDWAVQESIMGRKGPVLLHQGSDGNWLAMVVLFPEQGTGVLVAANASEEMEADKVLKGVLAKLFLKLSPAKGAK